MVDAEPVSGPDIRGAPGTSAAEPFGISCVSTGDVAPYLSGAPHVREGWQA